MRIEKSTLGKTSITRTLPWGLNRRHGHRLLCADGVIRAATLAETPDTFFSTPASIRVGGKTISGYMTMMTENDSNTGDKQVYVFRAHTDTGFTPWPSYDAKREVMPDAPSAAVFDAVHAEINAILSKAW